jgi:hypothetical protein
MPILSGGNVIPGDGLNSPPFQKAGALVANDFAGNCIVGSLAVDTTAGKLYICTATNGTTTSTWTVVGAQT